MGVQVHADVAAQWVCTGTGPGPGPGVTGCAPHPQVHVSMGMLVHGSADQQTSQSLPPLSARSTSNPAPYPAPWTVPPNGAPAAVWKVSTTMASTFSLSFRIPSSWGGGLPRRPARPSA
jgi:hypothetical protein